MDYGDGRVVRRSIGDDESFRKALQHPRSERIVYRKAVANFEGMRDAILTAKYSKCSSELQKCILYMFEYAYDKFASETNCDLLESMDFFETLFTHSKFIKKLPTWVYIQIVALFILMSDRRILDILPTFARRHTSEEIAKAVGVDAVNLDYNGQTFIERFTNVYIIRDETLNRILGYAAKNVLKVLYLAIYQKIMQLFLDSQDDLTRVDAFRIVVTLVNEHCVRCNEYNEILHEIGRKLSNVTM